MLKKLSAFILLTTSSCVVLYSQKTPEAPKQPTKPAQALIYSDMFQASGGYLGVQTQEVTRENFAKFGLSEVRGVAIEKVLENSPAAQAGLQDGDVIVRFEGEEITSTRKLNRLISEVAPDHKAKVTVLRSGSERDVLVTMGKRPTPKFFENGSFEMPKLPPVGEFKMQIPPGALKEFKMQVPPIGEMPQFKEFPKDKIFAPGALADGNAFFFSNNRQIGVSVSPLTKQLGEYFGIDGEARGLLINNVNADSPAAKAGLRAGDVIVEIEGKAVKNMVDLVRTLNENKEGDVTLTIIRDRSRQTVRVTPEKVKGQGEFFFQTDDGDGIVNIPEPPTPTIAPRVQTLVVPAPPEAPKVQVLPPARVM